MRKLLLIVAIIAIAASTALAKAPLEKPVEPYNSNSRAVEVEPNDDFASANALVAGDDMNAEFGVAGDIDYFAITLATGDFLDLETHAGDVGDTQMTLYDAAFNQVAYDDDGGAGLYSLIAGYEVLADGVYYVMVNEYGNNGTGTYILTAALASPPPPPPANDTCAGAIPIEHGAFTITGTTVSAVNDYALGSGSCTGYSANGGDVVFTLGLEAGESFEVTMTTDGFDDSIYLITDCADDFLSCVAGDDAYPDGSTFSYTAPVDQQLYLIVDGYGTSSMGEFTITGFNGGNVVDNVDTSFGSLKASYR